MQRKLMCLCLVVTLIAVAATLIACGDGVHHTKYIAVADSSNNRVLLYSFPVTTGQAASLVLGQTDLVSSNSATSVAGLSYPIKAVSDASGNLWVADCSNNRVVEYKTPFSNGMTATTVLGEPDMNT